MSIKKPWFLVAGLLFSTFAAVPVNASEECIALNRMLRTSRDFETHILHSLELLDESIVHLRRASPPAGSASAAAVNERISDLMHLRRVDRRALNKFRLLIARLESERTARSCPQNP